MDKMNAVKAVEAIKYAIIAVQYLEGVAQTNDNQEGKIIAAQVGRDEDVDLSRGFNSFKSHKKVSKTETALTGCLQYGELVMKHEDKAMAIPAAKVTETPVLTLSKSKTPVLAN